MDNRNARIAAVIAAVVAVLSVAALMASTYLGGDRGTPAAEPTATTGEVGAPAPAGPEVSTPTPTVPDEGSDHAGDPYTPNAKTKATLIGISSHFLAEWKRPGTPAERTTRLRPYATEWLTTRLAGIDPADLPTASVKGKPEVVAATPYAAATSTLFDDGIRIRCNLVLDTTGWRVSEVLPDSATPGPPSPTATPSTSPTPSPKSTRRALPAATSSPRPSPSPSPGTKKPAGAP